MAPRSPPRGPKAADHAPITISLFGLLLLLFVALKLGFPRDKVTLERSGLLAWELWRPLTAIFLFNKNGTITLVNAVLMTLHSRYLEAKYSPLRYLRILFYGAAGVAVLGWWLELTHLGDAMAFFILTLWCTRFCEAHIEELEGLPLPPWSIPWMFIAVFTALGHPAWEEATGAAVAYVLELWRCQGQALHSANASSRFGIGLSLFILTRAPTKAHLLGVPNYTLHWIGRQLWPSYTKLLDILLLFAEAFDIFVICLGDLLGPDQLLWQRVLSAFSLSTCFGLKASYPLLVVMAIQIGVVDRPQGPLFEILFLFAAVAMVQERTNQQRLREISDLDLNGDGRVSEEELRSVYGAEVANELLEIADTDGDGLLTEEEILGMYSSSQSTSLEQELNHRDQTGLRRRRGSVPVSKPAMPEPAAPLVERSLTDMMTEEVDTEWADEIDISDADWRTEGLLLEDDSPRPLMTPSRAAAAEESTRLQSVEPVPPGEALEEVGGVYFTPRHTGPVFAAPEEEEEDMVVEEEHHCAVCAARAEQEALAGAEPMRARRTAQLFTSADDLSILASSQERHDSECFDSELEVSAVDPLTVLPVSHVVGALVVAVPLLVLSPILVPVSYLVLAAVVPLCVLGGLLVTPGLLWSSMALYFLGSACCLAIVLAIDVLYFFPFAYLVICATALLWIPILAVIFMCCLPALLLGAGLLLGVAFLCTLALLPLFFSVAVALLGRSLLRTSLQVQHTFVTAPAVVITGACIILVHRAVLLAVFLLGVGSNTALRITDCTVDYGLRQMSTRMRDKYTTRKLAAVSSCGGDAIGVEHGSWKAFVSHMTPAVLCDPSQVTTLLNRDDLCSLDKLKYMAEIPTQPFQGLLLQGLNAA